MINKKDFQDKIKIKYKNFLTNQKNFFEKNHEFMTISNHSEHFSNPDYWNILLKEVKDNPENWTNKIALDFGCGCGRNLRTLLELADWCRVDGVDISSKNCKFAMEHVNELFPNKCKTWDNDGCTIIDNENQYDFIMSTITLQHIPSRDIRKSILLDMYSLIKPNGLISLQFGDMENSVSYFENKLIFDENQMNCRVENVQYIIDDLKNIGFKILDVRENTNVFHCKWYFIKVTKE